MVCGYIGAYFEWLAQISVIQTISGVMTTFMVGSSASYSSVGQISTTTVCSKEKCSLLVPMHKSIYRRIHMLSIEYEKHHISRR